MSVETYLFTFVLQLIEIFLCFSIPLVVALFLTGVLHNAINRDWLREALTPKGSYSFIKPFLLGLAFPGCSCSVIAYAKELQKSGVDRNSIMTFCLIGPQIGLPSFMVSLSLLGTQFTILRIALGTCIVIGVLVFINLTVFNYSTNGEHEDEYEDEDHAPNNAFFNEGIFITRAYRYGFFEIFSEMRKPFIITIVITAAVMAFGVQEFFQDLGHNLYAMCVASALFIPMDICATDSAPFARCLLGSGVSLGIVLIFIVTGPASNFMMIQFVYKSYGFKTCAAYLFSLFGTTLIMVSAFIAHVGEITVEASQLIHHEHGIITYLCAALLLRHLFLPTKIKKEEP